MIELADWYFGHIDSAIACAKCNEDGDYLVRYSINKQRYVISCRQKNTCHHFVLEVSRLLVSLSLKNLDGILCIQQKQSGEYFVGELKFKSVKELVSFAAQYNVAMNLAGVVLQKPVSKVDRWTMKSTDIEILNNIGSSSHFGEVCEALDKRTNTKVITRSYAGTIPKSLNAFLLEAEVLKQCSHFNLVR